jgi:hypothetical protein
MVMENPFAQPKYVTSLEKYTAVNFLKRYGRR